MHRSMKLACRWNSPDAGYLSEYSLPNLMLEVRYWSQNSLSRKMLII